MRYLSIALGCETTTCGLEESVTLLVSIGYFLGSPQNPPVSPTEDLPPPRTMSGSARKLPVYRLAAFAGPDNLVDTLLHQGIPRR